MLSTKAPSPELQLTTPRGFHRGGAAVVSAYTDFTQMNAAPDGEWLDTMVGKLITELERQLDMVSNAEKAAANPQERAADARTLASLERTLERLSWLERERAAMREKKAVRHGTDARAALERRLDQRLAATAKKGPAGKP